MNIAQRERLKEIVTSPSKILWEEPMKKHTSIKIGGPAECFIKVCDLDTLREIKKFAKKEQIPLTILGNGSNVLVLDNGIKGITLQIDIQKLEIKQTRNVCQTITVGAGNKVVNVAYKMLEKELSGMEELSGIPGTIGRSYLYECRCKW